MKQKGQVLILITVMIVVLIGAAGLVVDLGLVYITRAKVRNVADGIALASAKELPNESSVISKAQEYAGYNNVTTSELTVTTPYKGDSNKVEIKVTKNVPHYFMRIFGLTSSNVVGRAVGQIANVGTGGGLIPIAVPDTALPSCILWGPSSQCNDTSPSKGGGPLGSQYKGLVNFRSCDETAQIGDDCNLFQQADDYGNKPKNIQGWVTNSCNCQIAVGNDMTLYNGNLGSNMGTPLSNRCSAQGLSDGSGAYGLFTVLVYDEIIGSNVVNISGYAVYKVYCNDISSSSASGTFQSYVTAADIGTIIPQGTPTAILSE